MVRRYGSRVIRGISRVVGCLLALGSPGVVAASAASAVAPTPAPVSVAFGFTSAPQTFVVPVGVTALSVQAVGGGGNASEATDTIAVSPGQTLYVLVGGSASGTAGGFNGGGAGGSPGGFGGGGASDVRATTDPSSRLIVAGGAAGGGSPAPYVNGAFTPSLSPPLGGAGGIAGGNGGSLCYVLKPFVVGQTTSFCNAALAGGGGGQPGAGGVGGAGGSAAQPDGTAGAGGDTTSGGAGAAGSPPAGGGGGGGGGYGGGGGGGGDTPPPPDMTVDNPGYILAQGGGGGGGGSYAPGGTITPAPLGAQASVTITFTPAPAPISVATVTHVTSRQISRTVTAWIRCATTAPCGEHLSLTSSAPSPGPLAATTVTLPPGKVQAVALNLNGRARSVLRRARALRVTLTLEPTDPRATGSTTSLTLYAVTAHGR